MKQHLALAVALALVPLRQVHADTSANQAEQAVVMLEQIATLVDANKDNCDVMGDKLTAYMDKNGEQLKQLKAAGKNLTDAQKKAFTEKYQERMKVFGSKMKRGMQKCSGNAKVVAVMKTATAS